mmetsp:Transcript_9986/g.30413  ORF Transcript_9986/g.30413 Transcript_9986/m.30413 type:complete len:312 (+) Transcript_9986:37-972(+)
MRITDPEASTRPPTCPELGTLIALRSEQQAIGCQHLAREHPRVPRARLLDSPELLHAQLEHVGPALQRGGAAMRAGAEQEEVDHLQEVVVPPDAVPADSAAIGTSRGLHDGFRPRLEQRQDGGLHLGDGYKRDSRAWQSAQGTQGPQGAPPDQEEGVRGCPHAVAGCRLVVPVSHRSAHGEEDARRSLFQLSLPFLDLGVEAEKAEGNGFHRPTVIHASQNPRKGVQGQVVPKPSFADAAYQEQGVEDLCRLLRVTRPVNGRPSAATGRQDGVHPPKARVQGCPTAPLVSGGQAILQQRGDLLYCAATLHL